MRPFHAVFLVCALSTLACISVSGGPAGRYEVVEWTVTPADGGAQTVTDAGALQFGDLLSCDSGLATGGFDACQVDAGDNGVSIAAYEWIGGGFVPLYAPVTVPFVRPEWDKQADRWAAPIPFGNVSCDLSRDSRHPMVLVGEGCTTNGGEGPFSMELVMDR